MGLGVKQVLLKYQNRSTQITDAFYKDLAKEKDHNAIFWRAMTLHRKNTSKLFDDLENTDANKARAHHQMLTTRINSAFHNAVRYGKKSVYVLAEQAENLHRENTRMMLRKLDKTEDK